MVSQELGLHAQRLASEIEALRHTGGAMLQISVQGFKHWVKADRDRSNRFVQVKKAAHHTHGTGLELIRNGRWREFTTPHGQTLLVTNETADAMARLLDPRPKTREQIDG